MIAGSSSLFNRIHESDSAIRSKIQNEIERFPEFRYQAEFLIRTIPHMSPEDRRLLITIHLQTQEQMNNGDYSVGHVLVMEREETPHYHPSAATSANGQRRLLSRPRPMEERDRAYVLATGDLSKDIQIWPAIFRIEPIRKPTFRNEQSLLKRYQLLSLTHIMASRRNDRATPQTLRRSARIAASTPANVSLRFSLESVRVPGRS
ncbi:hypothetical protein BU24DRAFT_202646 [Aaosphaeria arxii CBS 175.79]|uniref:Uncharacterized protein n=1 Tax=Aaosphaeria arxii CBS 175.79 TaxID=1450172 RepID=A0A6A5XT76_9PLEO|nr:uncharacterized protein BU24DRAFT_202646 [Aaosphaeria arxii CBS 175.79]KAF2016488.1 hypothetical protein BU24DRAFT_202646 [Aaosphaeria arxii CBS 175.79]